MKQGIVEVDANGSMFLPEFARVLVRDVLYNPNVSRDTLRWVMHPYQEAVIDNIGLTVTDTIVVEGDVKDMPAALAKRHPRTLCLLPVFIMDTRPTDEIALVRKTDGEIVGRIKNLGGPVPL